MKEIYAEYVEHSFGEYEQSAFKIKEFEYNYRRFLPDNMDADVLDIGIGRGEMLSCMKKWGYKNYLGIDISPSTVKFCSKLGLNCVLIEDTAEWLEKNAGKYDLITIIDVLEHIPKNKIIDLLKAMKAALKKGGRVIIQVPNMQAPEPYLHRYNDFTHEVGFVEHSFGQILKAAGFSDIRLFGFESVVLGGVKSGLWKCARSVFWGFVRFTRKLNYNLNPRILNPIIFAVVENR